MKYMRNYATEGDFTTDKPNMDSIESDGKIWMSYIKEPKSVKIKYTERPMFDHNAIIPNTETLPYTGGTVEFDVYLIEPQSQLNLYLPDAYYDLYPDLDLNSTKEKISELHYKFKLKSEYPISTNNYNNEIPYLFYIEGDDNGIVLASCTVTQAGKPYNDTVNSGGYIRGTISGISTGSIQSPLIGATVKIGGMQQATTTGSDGSFELQVAQGGNNLYIEISYVGYQAITIPASTVDELTILLIEDSSIY